MGVVPPRIPRVTLYATAMPLQRTPGENISAMAVGIGADRQWQRFCQAAGREDLAGDPRFATNAGRVENRAAIIPILQALFAARDAEEWLNLLLAEGIPCGPINTVDQALADPQAQHRGMVVEIPHPTAGAVKLVAPPYKLSRTPAAIVTPPPLLGQDTEAVLTGILGYAPEQMARLKESGAISGAIF